MADKGSGGSVGAAGRAPVVDQPTKVRNVALVGHSGAGKTTLVEALLAAAGTLQRTGRVEDGTTVSDYEEVEARQQRSVSLTLAPISHAGIKVNLLDTPGYPDFVGDLRAGLRAADAALFVVSATDGIDGMTRALWDECAGVGMPRAVVLTKLDHQRADVDSIIASCQDAFGPGVLPLYLPVSGGEAGVRGIIGLLTQRLFDYSSGERVESQPAEEDLERIDEARNALLEGIIEESEDETLMDRYLDGEEIDTEALIGDLERAVSRGSFFPALTTASLQGVGMAELLEIITQGFPSPPEREIPEVTTVEGKSAGTFVCDPDGPLLAEVVKTSSDPYVGRISMVRVFSGTLRPDTVVHVSGHGLTDRGHEDHDVDERVGALSSPLGKNQRTVSMAVAGDICTVAKLAHAETGDTLSGKDKPLLMNPWTMPDPLLPVAVQAKSKTDEDKLSQSLARLVAEDPTLRLEMNTETHQLVLWCMGEAHTDVLLDRLANRYGVEVEPIELRVPLRETFGNATEGFGKNVKQTGGHGQYGVCYIEVEPLPAGSGFEFVDKIVGGVIPRQYIPSVEKGVRSQMEKGVRGGYPVVDLRVTVYDGKAHSVDSSDMAFQVAGQLALKDAAGKIPVLLLEPVDEISVLVHDGDVGTVMSDLSSRRGRVLGTEPVGTGRTMIKAEVPEVEITRYAIDLRAMSHGTGAFNRTYLRHDPMPTHLAGKMMEAEKQHA